MTDKITLFCLACGNSAENVFPVRISKMLFVGDLKKLIKKEKAPRFDDFAADELTLYKVNIPGNDAAIQQLPKVLHEDKDKGIEKLQPTWDISDYFPVAPTKKHIHVIVERPPASSGKTLLLTML